MKKNEQCFFILKFGKKRHLKSLREKGELYFNSTKMYNEITDNDQQGDENEGATWIKNTDLSKITVDHPSFGKIELKTFPNHNFKLSQYNHNYLTCSFYIITSEDFIDTNNFQIDKKMLEFGKYALIIKSPRSFFKKVFDSIKKEKLKFHAKKVEYLDINKKGLIELNPFTKKLEHKHQKEYRIILENLINPRPIYIKEIKDISEIVLSKHIVESNWKALRK